MPLGLCFCIRKAAGMGPRLTGGLVIPWRVSTCWEQPLPHRGPQARGAKNVVRTRVIAALIPPLPLS